MPWTPAQRLESRQKALTQAQNELARARDEVTKWQNLVAELKPSKTSKAGVDFVASHEGVRLKAYKDAVGVWTIGYGHTRGVHEGDVITEQQALDFLRVDLGIAEKAIVQGVTVPLYQSMFDALVSLAFNIGTAAFAKSTLLRLLNAGNYMGAADQFSVWNRGGGKVLPGLVKRRADEKALFLKEMQ